jgi:DNA-binding LytR/AlgR family response regulator
MTRGDKMQIEIRIDPECAEPKIIILTDRMSGEVDELARRLSEGPPQVLAGFQGDTLKILEQRVIFRVYSQAGKVLAETDSGTYVLHLRLYEAEARLDKSGFVRISNSEIVNLKKVGGFDLSFTGTICVSLSNGTVTYVSRRYVARIKQVLGI